MSRVLIFSHPGDLHADAVRWSVERLGGAASVVDTDRPMDNHQFRLTHRAAGPPEVVIDGEVFDSLTSSAWLRRPYAKAYSSFSDIHALDQEYARWSCGYFYGDLLAVASRFRLPVSPEIAIQQMESKFLQLQFARRCGLTTAEALFTNDSEAAKRFCGLGRRISKDFRPFTWVADEGSYYSGARPTTTGDIEAAGATIRQSPVLLQELVPSVDELRVTIIGRNVFPASLGWSNKAGAAPDWRLDHLNMTIQATDLPDAVRRKLLDFMDMSGLNFAAIDLIRTSDDYVFLEANSSGQWLWKNRDLEGLPLLDCFAKFLLSGDARYVYSETRVDCAYEDYFATRGAGYLDESLRNQAGDLDVEAYLQRYHGGTVLERNP